DPMSVRVNHEVHEVRIVERRRGPVVGFIGEAPGWRPRLPKVAAQRPPVLLETGAATLGVEVPLIPESGFSLGCSWRLPRSDGVRHRVPADEDRGANTIRMKRGRNSRGAAAPVVPGDGEAREPQRIRKVDDVLSYRSLLRHP